MWEVAEHRYLCIEEVPERAGYAMNTIYVDNLDRLADIAERAWSTPSSRPTRTAPPVSTSTATQMATRPPLGVGPRSLSEGQSSFAVVATIMDREDHHDVIGTGVQMGPPAGDNRHPINRRGMV